ncbi:MAG: hypothetical protein INF91_01590, partial [Alphaproteobacteria bacterium]|nr:hypothetical protein [Alphaproteobacteria bacterium]
MGPVAAMLTVILLLAAPPLALPAANPPAWSLAVIALVYLAVYQQAGLAWGLIAALALLAPFVWRGAEPAWPALAALHLLAVHALRRQVRTHAAATGLVAAAIYAAVAALDLWLAPGAPALLAVRVAETALAIALAAAALDAFNTSFRFDARTRRIRLGRPARSDWIVAAYATLLILLGVQGLLAADLAAAGFAAVWSGPWFAPVAPAAEAAAREVAAALLGYGWMAALAFALARLFGALVDRSVRGWAVSLAKFGRSRVTPGARLPLREFDDAARAFARANNAFMAAVEARDAAAIMVDELRRSIGLQLIRSVRFTADGDSVEFEELTPDGRFLRRLWPILPVDAPRVATTLAAGDSFFEFRLAADPGEWCLLVVRTPVAATTFLRGFYCRLRQPRPAVEAMRQKARLIELGSMSGVISHELKQPLFTIKLAAGNGRADLAADGAEGLDAAIERFDRIAEQAARAEDIIGRIVRFARAEPQGTEAADVDTVIRSAVELVRPVFDRSGVRVSAHSEGDGLRAVGSRTGLEQVVVNALQNALESILEKRRTAPDFRG